MNLPHPLKPEVQKVFEAYLEPHQQTMLTIRRLIFEVANSIEGVGEIEETLKWGEPAYLTNVTKSGSTIRIDWKPQAPNQYALYFNCQTNLVERFRNDHPDAFKFEGNRAISFPIDKPIPVGPLSDCIATALTYHRDKGKARNATAKRFS